LTSEGDHISGMSAACWAAQKP